MILAISLADLEANCLPAGRILKLPESHGLRLRVRVGLGLWLSPANMYEHPLNSTMIYPPIQVAIAVFIPT